MRLIGVAMVRNEADIIEAFVRHNLALLDQLVVVDHGSTDRTRDILAQLQAEGLALRLAEVHGAANQQARVLTAAIRDTVRAGGADYVLPLDADEFLRADRAGLREALGQVPRDGVASIRWLTYVSDPEVADPNPLARARWRVPLDADRVVKVALGAELAGGDDWMLAPGSHLALRRAGAAWTAIEAQPLESVRLAHLPFRSIAQLVVKVVQGWLGTRLQEGPGARTGLINAHWRRMFEHYVAGHAFDSADLRRLTLTTYVRSPDGDEFDPRGLVEDPLPTQALRHTGEVIIDPARALAQWADRLLDQLAGNAGAQSRSKA